MKPAPFAYHDPRSINDLIGLLGRLENAKLLAGGQSLMPMLNMRYVIPDHLIDLNRLPDLQGVQHADGKLHIGAMTRQRSLQRDALVQQYCPILAEALGWVGHIQTRSRGTIGGSLCHLDPAAEQPGIVALYDGELTIAGPDGTRQMAMRDWGLGFMMPNLAPEEVLTRISLTPWSGPHGHGFVEFARRHGDFAIVGAGSLLALDGAGLIKRAALVLVGVDIQPMRLLDAEQALIGQPAESASFAAAAALASQVEALSDAHISSSYRQKLAGVMTRRALELAADRARKARHV